MKRLVRMTAALALTMGLLASPAAAEPPIQVLLQGAQVQFDAEPYIENNRTLVPLRALSERLGFQVGWAEVEQKITLTKGDTTLVLWIGKLDATVNGKALMLEVAPVIHGTRTFVPVRFISEHLGANVFWDGEKRHIRVTPAGASDPDALGWLTQTPAAINQSTVTKGEFSMQVTKDGDAPMVIKGALTFQTAGLDTLGSMNMSMVMDGSEIPIAQIQMAVRNGTAWMKMPAGMMGPTASWQAVGPATGPGAPAGSVPPTAPGVGLGAFTPSDLAKLTASMKEQVAVTFGPSETKDGKQLVRVDVDMSRIDFEKLLGSVLGSSFPKMPTGAGIPKVNAKLSVLMEAESKLVRAANLDATITGSAGEQMVLKFAMTTDPTKATITWPADLPSSPPTVPASGAEPINPPPTTTKP